MTGPDRTIENIQRLPEATVGEMRHIQDHAQAIHFLDQFPSALRQPADLIMAQGVAAHTIVSWSHGAQPLFPVFFKIAHGPDGVRAFQAQHIADGFIVVRLAIAPQRHSRIQGGQIRDLAHLPFVLHRLIPG